MPGEGDGTGHRGADPGGTVTRTAGGCGSSSFLRLSHPMAHINMTTPSSILPHQRSAFHSLLEVGSACFAISRESLSIAPRTNTLIVGPTGTGKTFLARQVAESLGVDFMGISVSEWMPLGCSNRGAVSTWPSVFNFLLRNHQKPGVVLFVDELCKLGVNSWDTYVKVEVFRLLDLSITKELTDEFSEKLDLKDHAMAQEVLRKRTFLIGAGAFQEIWESSGPGIGFMQQVTATDISLSRLAKALPRELINRFRSKIITLPALAVTDYSRMLELSLEHIPSCLRQRFNELGRERVAEAARQQQGVRFLEELILDAILLERKFMQPCRAEQLEFDFRSPAVSLDFGIPDEVTDILDATLSRGHIRLP
jgi:hypothetical protein